MFDTGIITGQTTLALPQGLDIEKCVKSWEGKIKHRPKTYELFIIQEERNDFYFSSEKAWVPLTLSCGFVGTLWKITCRPPHVVVLTAPG